MTPPTERHTGLGRGLGALIPQTSPAGAAPVEIPISRIRGNPYQPRQRVEQQALESLAASIAIHGVLQPVLVTEVLDGYQLVAGERRVRAAQMAGLDHIPAIVRQMTERDQLAVALVENVQRADLNAMEEAHAYRQLADEFGLTQDQIAERVGRARSTVTNTMRLLELDPSVQTGDRRRRHLRGPRPRPRRSTRRASDSCVAGRHGPRAVRSPDGGTRPPASRAPGAQDTRRPRPTPTSSISKKTCAAPSAPRCSWRDPGRADASSSSTTATKSCPASSTD